MRAIVAYLICLLLLSGSPAFVSSTSADGTSPFLTDALRIGQALEVGQRLSGGDCYFPTSPHVESSVGPGSAPQWLALAINDACVVSVAGRWTGALLDGPPDIVEATARLVATSGDVIQEATIASDADAGWAPPESAASSGCKTSEQHVYMYGYGGPGDRLTIKTGKLRFCWNGSQAWATSQSGFCQATGNGYWQWRVDACLLTGYDDGPGGAVFRSGQGNYHCNPPSQFPCSLSTPDGYYHSILDLERGQSNGTSFCSAGWSGVIVSGVSRTIIQGCS
jgi:hypothetical protein